MLYTSHLSHFAPLVCLCFTHLGITDSTGFSPKHYILKEQNISVCFGTSKIRRLTQTDVIDSGDRKTKHFILFSFYPG